MLSYIKILWKIHNISFKFKELYYFCHSKSRNQAWNLGYKMIIDTHEIEDTIHIVSKVLEAMNHHAIINNIDSMYHGFIDTLHLYEERLSKIIKNFKNAVEFYSFEKYSCINNEVIGINLCCI